MTDQQAQLDAVMREIQKIDPAHFQTSEGSAYGWYGEIGTALIDAVFSIRATYNSAHPDRGVLHRVEKFRVAHPEAAHDLRALVDLGPEAITELMTSARTSGRQKSDCVIEAAQALLALEPPVVTADDLREATPKAVEDAYTGVRGLGGVTCVYFQMLLGQPGVKPDRMIIGFVNAALASAGLPAVGKDRVDELVREAYARDDRGAPDLSRFDHAIWLQKGRLGVTEEEDTVDQES